MGNLVTRLTTNNIQLNESNVSDVAAPEVVKTPAGSGQTKSGLFKNIWNYDPRSPSTFISRTPIAIFRSNSASKFNHKTLNESIESQVDLDILTPEEQDSLDSNQDLAQIGTLEDNDIEKIPDPRSPITEIVRTPIVAVEEVKKKKEDNLVKKLADKLIQTAISDEEKKTNEENVTNTKKSKKDKHLIFEDDENTERYSTPPKQKMALKDGATSRTPLGCVSNSNTPKSRSYIPIQNHSTPKHLINFDDSHSNSKSVSRIPVSARRLH